ncbi:MAG: C25 family cysteine peptidase, partial [Rhodothermales bacterium]|nr:C25 family cysteine peptidase [Rhodothermales bacterium]
RVEDQRLYHDGDGTLNAENPFYTRGEGWYTNQLRHSGTESVAQNLAFVLSNLIRSPDDSVRVRARLTSITATRHRAELSLESTASGTLAFQTADEADWTGYEFQTFSGAVASQHVAANNRLGVRLISHNEFAATPNILYYDWVTVEYTRALAAQSNALRFSYPTAGSRRLRMTGFSGGDVRVFNPRDRRVFRITPAGQDAIFADQSSGAVTYWAAAPAALKTPAAFEIDRASDWAATTHEADYVIVTTRALRGSAEAMADYRRVRNGFDVAVVDVQDLFDQFDYGRPTPLAIRRFVHQTLRWRKAPRFLLFWGDTVYPDRLKPRDAWDVPSYGKASSDGWYAMETQGPGDWYEALAVGRIPTREDAEGLLFLQKVQTYESGAVEDWNKRMMMMVGGSDTNEQRLLQSFVLPWSRQALAAPSGMDTLHFFRNSNTATTVNFQDSLRVALREGASWLSYFGHSAASTWEIVVDPPEDFNNATRLPVALSLGCRTGAFAGGLFQRDDFKVLGEALVVGSLNGSIAHWGTSGLSSISASAAMGKHVHDVVFADTMRTLGRVFQEAKRRYVASGAFSLRDLVQFSLIGDPATQISIPTRPELVVEPEQIRITPAAPIPSDEAITVDVALKNRGLVPEDSVTVTLVHAAPDGAETTYTQRVAPFALTQDVRFVVPIDEALVGDNRFRVSVDPEDRYREENDANNSAERRHTVFSAELTLVAPLDMSAVGTDAPRFRVTFVPQQRETAIVFELDTAPSFDTPGKRTHRAVTTGSFAVWQPEAPLEADRVYYWRARIETEDGLKNWREAAFFAGGEAGGSAWTQAGPLFERNEHAATLSRQDGAWALADYPVEVFFSAARGSSQFKGMFVVEGQAYERLGLGFGLLVLDGVTGRVKASGSFPTYQNRFVDPVEARAGLEALIAGLETGDYVFVRTRPLANESGPVIPEDIKTLFRSIGSTTIDDQVYGDLWLMRTRIGYPEETREWVDPIGGTNEIVQEEVLFFQEPRGTTRSPRIGPAREWTTLSWQAALPNADSSVRIDVLDADTGEALLDSLAQAPVDLSAIDAQAHPFLRLRATLADPSQRATPQLTRWSVDFTSTPELVIDNTAFTLSADTLQEAEPLAVTARVLNLSDAAADSVVVRLFLTDPTNRTRLAGSDTLTTLTPDEAAEVHFRIETAGLVGKNQLKVEAEQPGLTERLTFNNTALAEFRVLGDAAPPLLAVTVDGEALPHNPEPLRNLQDPDLPQLPNRPIFEVVLEDENLLKPLTDTTLVTVRLDGRRIPFTSPDLVFEPGTGTRNEARVRYTPDFTGEDAAHTFSVEAFDVAGNEAEGSPYQVHFRVASSFEIGSIYPYPNPMSGFTRFAFLVRGSDTAGIDDLRIRVYTLTGRVVQEFDLVRDPGLLDGGGLRIGWNKVFWDGRDADGDLLAPGVYLYKIFLTVDGEPARINNDAGIEKLVILR